METGTVASADHGQIKQSYYLLNIILFSSRRTTIMDATNNKLQSLSIINNITITKEIRILCNINE